MEPLISTSLARTFLLDDIIDGEVESARCGGWETGGAETGGRSGAAAMVGAGSGRRTSRSAEPLD